ncbi:hypothetical protein HK098_007105 [Nowakowskiella sp. JEL0407]|nr:hypothetical protein HK098_007105 [Nowakowskiella sp. JEL0407]
MSSSAALATHYKIQQLCELAVSGDISHTALNYWASVLLNITIPQPAMDITCCKNVSHVLITISERTILRFLTFVNIIWFISIVLGAVALYTLTHHYFVYLLIIPAVVLETIVFAVSFIVLRYAKLHPLSSSLRDYVGLTGAIMLCVITVWCLHKYFPLMKETSYPSVLTILLFGITMKLRATIIGVLCVWSCMAAFGFLFGAMPWGYYIGFTDATLKPAIASFALLAVVTTAHITNFQSVLQFVVPFRTGVFFWCTFVYLLAILIQSFRYYAKRRVVIYIVNQVIVLVSLVAALYLGTVYDIEQFRNIGGTFAVLYGLSKTIELPWEKMGVAWGILFASITLWVCGYVIQQNPEYFWQ